MPRITFGPLSLVVVLIALLAFSCTEATDSSIPEPAVLSEAEVAEVMEEMITPSTGGLTENLTSLSTAVQGLTLQDLCNSLYSDSLDYGYQGTNRQAAYSALWALDLSCNAFNIPQSGTVSYASTSNFVGPRVNSEGNVDFTSTLSGLQFASPNLVWDGTYQRVGIQELSFRQGRTILSTLELSLTNVIISKQNPTIMDGSGTFTIDIANNGSTSVYTGTIVFHGNSTATLVVNGVSFPIDWS